MNKYTNQHLHQILRGAVEALGEKMNRYTEKAFAFEASKDISAEILAQYAQDCTRPAEGEEGHYLWSEPIQHNTEEGSMNVVVYITAAPVKHYALDTKNSTVFDLDRFIAYQLGYIQLPTENSEAPAQKKYIVMELDYNKYKGTGKCWIAKIDPETKKILSFLDAESIQKRDNYSGQKTFKIPIIEGAAYQFRETGSKSKDNEFYRIVKNGKLEVL